MLAELKARRPVEATSHASFALSVAAFNRISQYDGAISDYLSSIQVRRGCQLAQACRVPRRRPTAASSSCKTCATARTRTRQAAFYRDLYPAPGSLVTAQQLQGKELSYNNIADADAAWECVKSFDAPACVIVKHANPCGVAVGKDALEAYSKAFQTDPTSAFGGIIALNRVLDGAGAQAISKQFVEVLMAPGYTPEALEIFKAKANVRVLEIAMPPGGARRGTRV